VTCQLDSDIIAHGETPRKIRLPTLRSSTDDYNLLPTLARFKIGSIFVAFITSPLTFSPPLINSFCAFALPLTSFPKLSSLMLNVTVAFSGGAPLPTVPVFLRSMYQDSSTPAAFLRLKAKMALPFLMASVRPAASVEREVEMASKAAEEG
jgi:hypothetical protein